MARSRIAVHFDLAEGQMPENIALSPRGTAYVTFAATRQVASVTPTGAVRIPATAYVLNAAYTTTKGPNLILATLPRH
ncbi:hypothetical protein QLQ12_30955 [Actinoplanes sp. NEAU-A12]|uniref:SMP-30/Gluconolactonase/LRE-like region domain-containing protein n=1 Tax=Actinoplanes sandaracinus TaxID=3045177 RepID=A0ABT6WTH5_9ACTN|nr:hypothetical protein [Actinoplanes sandaracinus]MDI6103043.1 hypothetical protein [Actinoplanes sandaracinus]